jgi:hypothetical protein
MNGDLPPPTTPLAKYTFREAFSFLPPVTVEDLLTKKYSAK